MFHLSNALHVGEPVVQALEDLFGKTGRHEEMLRGRLVAAGKVTHTLLTPAESPVSLPQPKIELVEGVGVMGDKHAGAAAKSGQPGKGAWHTPRV